MFPPVKRVAIIGGGTAGWMTAAWMAQVMRRNIEDIVLVESDDIGTVGVGEATIPSIRKYNHWLGLDEDEMLRRTQGTFKLGIEFVNWGHIGNRYHHSFGPNGRELYNMPFHAAWLRGGAGDLGDYNLQTQASLHNKFMRPTGANSPLASIVYAFQFDASLFARYLREFSETRGVQRVEGKIVDVTLRPDDGFIDAVTLENGTRIAADLFIDCSGFRGLLIDGAMKSAFVDWSNWLPCDRAWAVPTSSPRSSAARAPHNSSGGRSALPEGEPSGMRSNDIPPYTRSTAHTAGWQWRIPLQHRVGNGHVFASAFMDEDEARRILLDNLDGEPLAEPRLLKFKAGRRQAFWVKNCVAIGLSGGFLEPLESTSIFLIQNAIARLQVLFPDKGFDPVDIAFFNAQSVKEYEDVRDFIILHYKLSRRSDSAFWTYCRDMPVPDRLQQRMALFQSRGRIFEEKGEQFGLSSWLAVLWGQGLRPAAPDPMTLAMSEDQARAWLAETKSTIDQCCAHMPSHADFIARHCAADT